MTLLQGSQEQEVKFQDQMFSKFQDIFVGFMRLKTQKMHVFLCSQILISRADQYCSYKNFTKAMLHMKYWEPCTLSSAPSGGSSYLGHYKNY